MVHALFRVPFAGLLACALLAPALDAAADPPKGIVIDLRDNSGGYIHDVGRALAHFFPDRQPYAWVDFGYLPRFPYRTRPPRDVWTGPVAVVIGDGSASGAEVFAATFQETGRGPVFGLKSIGAVVASRARA